MSKVRESQAQTKKEQWCGQDNLSLQIGNFSTLTRWFDVDEKYTPVKYYAEAMEKVILNFTLNRENVNLFNTLRKLYLDLKELDGEIDKIMKEGGPSCR